LLGPYEFKEVVLKKRTDNWDNTRVHNGKIVRTPDGKFVIYHIDTANETGYAWSDSIDGPWKRLDKPVMKISNPAPLVRPDGSVYVFGRLGVGEKDARVNRGVAYVADAFDKPYKLLEDGRNLLPDDYELEDPTIWWAADQYNVLLNDWKGKATGVPKGGAQYASKDGIKYELVSKAAGLHQDGRVRRRHERNFSAPRAGRSSSRTRRARCWRCSRPACRRRTAPGSSRARWITTCRTEYV
jgi:hypothetical protein